MKYIIRSTTGVLLAGMIAAGCSTAPSASEQEAANTAISNAGQTVDRASADPHVTQYASTELERASDSLGQAKKAWNDKHDLTTTMQYAYVAQQRAATAEELGNQRAAEEALTAAAAKRDRAVAEYESRPRSAPGGSSGPAQASTAGSLAGFPFGKAKLPRSSAPRIAELANALKNNPGSLVVIEGHTDNVGSPNYNQGLAMQRAEAVRAALLRQGVDTGRIAVRSHGEGNPVASNDTKAGRSENRRVDVFIAAAEAPAAGSSTTSSTGSSTGSTSATSSGSGSQGGQSGQSSQSGQGNQGQQPQQQQ